MSQENVEIVRRVFDAVANRDSASILALYDPDVVIDFSDGTLADRIGQGGTYRGHDGLRAFDQELRDAFDDFETNCEELIEAGPRVLSVSRYRARGRRSGLEIDGPLQFGIWTIRNGTIIRVDWFDEREEAFEAAGLSE
jgi:ketosteroid isomerase-like protein